MFLFWKFGGGFMVIIITCGGRFHLWSGNKRTGSKTVAQNKEQFPLLSAYT